jgi:hypothetical protein
MRETPAASATVSRVGRELVMVQVTSPDGHIGIVRLVVVLYRSRLYP